ncbi:AI-2E family transporter [uncultured archaeon]|nr:AI-2E family transporter [uncultured archaeon]
MVDKHNFKDLINYVLIAGLFILAAVIIYPIIYSIIYGILLAYLFFPLHKWLKKRLKSDFLSALFVCIGLLIILTAAVILLFGAVFNQIVNFYLFLQKIDIVAIIRSALPNFISSSGVSENIISSISNQVSNMIAGYLKGFTGLIADLPSIIIQVAVVIFTFFFALKDGEKAIDYFKAVSPLKKETEERFFKQFKEITNSVLIGQIFVGIVQGITAGIGYFIFGVPNATLLTFVTIIMAIIPVIGAWIVWVPVDIYLFSTGRTGAGIGLLIYGGAIITWIDNVVRTIIVARNTKINLWVILIGMLGGLLVFGFLGLIIGPLILAYVLLVIEVYRKSTVNDDLIFKKSDSLS